VLVPVLIVLAAACALTDWIGVARQDDRLRRVTKPLTMVVLIVLAIVGDDGRLGAEQAWIVVGLVLSLVGDVFLQADERWFVAGLGSFLAAHVAYVVAMLIVGVAPLGLAIGLVLAVTGSAIVGRQVVAAVARSTPGLRLPVVAYTIVISTMLVMALGTTESWLILAGVLFYVSDSILGWNRFVRPTSWMPLAVMVTYHLAQGGFVAFVVAG
jgi:uncharacterized membrane protein YhhN